MKPISLLFVLVTVFVLAACSQAGVSEETSAGGQPSIDSESATNIAESPDAFLTPIEVTYITPGQGEGPYYPLEKLDDRDNDLTVLDGAAGAPAGEVIEFTGKVYDSASISTPAIRSPSSVTEISNSMVRRSRRPTVVTVSAPSYPAITNPGRVISMLRSGSKITNYLRRSSILKATPNWTTRPCSTRPAPRASA